jgi:hypothetical protein
VRYRPVATKQLPRTLLNMDGPLMIAATKILKPGPTRIARIAPGITLPRTIPITTLFVAGGFAIVGLVLTALIPLTRTATSMMLGTLFFGAAGVMVTTYSPMKGESMTRWLGLSVTSRRQRVELNGEPARVYIGICPIDRVAVGEIQIVSSAVAVPAGSVDKRGLPLKQRVFSRVEAREDRPETSPQTVPYFVGAALDGWAQASTAAPQFESPFSLGNQPIDPDSAWGRR